MLTDPTRPNTFMNPHNASGLGPRQIHSEEWVQVSCKMLVAPTIKDARRDGYWYRIAPWPWSNAYYSPANNFVNGVPPADHRCSISDSKSIGCTDFNVPDC